MIEEKVKEALSSALGCLHIAQGKECSEKLPPTLKKTCEERKMEFKKAYEVLKEFLNSI